MPVQDNLRLTEEYALANNPGDARWCGVHNRLECTKNRRKGRGDCHQWATAGTNACRFHSGKKRVVLKAEGQMRISAWSAQGKPAGKPIGASTAVISVLEMSWLRLNTISELLRQQVAKENKHNSDPSEDGDPQVSGLIGFRYAAAGKDGRVYVQSEEVRALARLEAEERDRVVRYSKVAHDMGISERMTALAERWGDLVADALSKIIDGLELSPEQSLMVPRLVQSHLGSIDLEALGAGENKRP